MKAVKVLLVVVIFSGVLVGFASFTKDLTPYFNSNTAGDGWTREELQHIKDVNVEHIERITKRANLTEKQKEHYIIAAEENIKYAEQCLSGRDVLFDYFLEGKY